MALSALKKEAMILHLRMAWVCLDTYVRAVELAKAEGPAQSCSFGDLRRGVLTAFQLPENTNLLLRDRQSVPCQLLPFPESGKLLPPEQRVFDLERKPGEVS